MPAAVRLPPDLPPEGSLARSIGLFRAFRVEQTDPDTFYGLLAADTLREVGRDAGLVGRGLRDAVVLDVGGGPGYFADAFRAVGARYAGVDPDVGELTARGDRTDDGAVLRASGLALPLADGSVDVAMSSNVLEHVRDTAGFLAELLRVARPGGLVWVSWTPWLSPWGGHETAPWHYLGGRRAADRYARRHGRRPKNDFGRSLFAVPASRVLRWARAQEAAGVVEVLDVRPRYHPAWARWVAAVPGLREVVSWNVVVVLRRR